MISSPLVITTVVVILLEIITVVITITIIIIIIKIIMIITSHCEVHNLQRSQSSLKYCVDFTFNLQPCSKTHHRCHHPHHHHDYNIMIIIITSNLQWSQGSL